MADAPQAYCVKCREKREIKDPVDVTMKNGRPAVKGVCPVCGTALFRIGSGSAEPAAAAASAEPKKAPARSRAKAKPKASDES